MNRRHLGWGFSLVEMTAVLLIISLVAGMGINLGSNAMKGADKLATQEKLAVIKMALNQFAQQNGYLPCPAPRNLAPSAAAFGAETRSNGALPNTCTTSASLVLNNSAYIGMLPIRTLGLPDSYAADAWSNKFTYAVSSGMIGAPGSANAPLAAGIVLRYGVRSPATSYQPAYRAPVGSGTPGTGYVAFVVVSHGASGIGGYALQGTSAIGTCGTTTADSVNCDDDNIFLDGKYNDGSQGAQFFDDFLVWGTNLNTITPPATNVYGTTPIGCGSLTTTLPYCEGWCAPCTNNIPAAPASFTNPVLCSKVMTATNSTCQATCTWGGLISSGSKYQPCP